VQEEWAISGIEQDSFRNLCRGKEREEQRERYRYFDYQKPEIF
jgi:hypothetical protein